MVALPFAISLAFVITDFDAVISTRTGLPIVEAYYQATGSKAGTVVLMAGFALCFFGCACANITSSSRQMWSASRDNCFPLSRWWKQVHPRFNMPFNAACASGTFVTVSRVPVLRRRPLILISALRSDLPGLLCRFLIHGKFSSMSKCINANLTQVGACIVFMTTSYVVPQGILAWRGREKVLPKRHMDLGKFGLPLNVLACVWVVFVDVLYCFPTAYPVTTENMNWIR